jgi:hypothetical protein
MIDKHTNDLSDPGMAGASRKIYRRLARRGAAPFPFAALVPPTARV